MNSGQTLNMDSIFSDKKKASFAGQTDFEKCELEIT
jgi:hypothetical protein